MLRVTYDLSHFLYDDCNAFNSIKVVNEVVEAEWKMRSTMNEKKKEMTTLHCNTVMMQYRLGSTFAKFSVTEATEICSMAVLICPHYFSVPSDVPLPTIIKTHKNQFNKGWLNKKHIFNYIPNGLRDC